MTETPLILPSESVIFAAMQRLFKKNQVIEVTISDMAFGGVGIAKIPTEQGDFAVFVQNTIPGQLVRARVVKCDKRYAECSLQEVLHSSPDEESIPYQRIPGAPYATLPVSKQHEYKLRSAIELYRRIGKVENIEAICEGLISSPTAWHYRNKMEYSFSVIRFDENTQTEHDDFGLGFKHRGTWWCVENLNNDSGMFDATLENALHRIRQWCMATGLPAWHPPQRHGFFRFLVARKSFHSNQVLLNLVTHDQGLESFDRKAFVELLKDVLGERLAGVLHTINPEIGDRIDPLSGKTDRLYGSDHVVESILGLAFEISMTSFFQTNPKCAERLYQKVIDFATAPGAPSDGVLMDLFCGTGTIAQLLARSTGKEVVGVDIVESAIEDARRNALRNGLKGLTFHAADVGKFLVQFPEYRNRIHTVVLDPPRAGIAPKTLRKVMDLSPQRLVYVSCNPATQARDVLVLSEGGYVLKSIVFVDQFPHTAHLEAVAWFEKQ